ncbi:MAG: SMI1/KNR4 family protein [Acetatifactor sp.]|nr:SMI1/KNR4 family protein [Acetatifactor sp.]
MMAEELLSYLRKRGWTIVTDPKSDRALPGEITDRYENISPQWYDFISGLNVLMNERETTWFLCFKDFYEQDEGAFQWNEWERVSLESAADDEKWKKEIRAFWDRHFPIVLSVRNGYSYYAISMENGAVVCGFEPEFEECETVADSFEEFAEKIVSGKIEL